MVPTFLTQGDWKGNSARRRGVDRKIHVYVPVPMDEWMCGASKLP